MRRLPLLILALLAIAALLWVAGELHGPPGGAAHGVPLGARELPLDGPAGDQEKTPLLEAPARRAAVSHGEADSGVRIARVLAVDERGLPVAGLPLGAYRDATCDGASSARATTGEDGVATIVVAGDEWTSLARRDGFAWIAAAAPVRPRERLQVELGALLEEPLRLTVGPTGALRLLFVGERPEDEGLVVELGPRTEGAELAGSVHELGGRELFLPHVALGAEFALRARSATGRELGSFALIGPTRRGEELTVELALAPTRPRVRATLVDAEGAPLARCAVSVRCPESEDERVQRSGRTDDEGAFAFDGWAGAAGEEVLVRFEMRRFPLDYEGEARVRRGAPGEEIELGEVRLDPPPLLAAGRVLSEDGEPIRRARVLPLRPEPVAGHWLPLAVEAGLTDLEGRFELRGRLKEAEIALRVVAGAHLAAPPVRVRVGERELVVRLAAAGAIYGWVMFEEGLPAEAVLVELADLTGEDGVREATRKKTWEDGFSFTCGGLPPGAATVRVRLAGEDEPLFVAAGVEVPAGGMSYDERVQGIDLCGLLRLHVVEVVDPRGAPVPGARVRYRASLGGGAALEAEVEEGRAVVVTRAAAVDVEVAADGFRTQAVEAVAGRARVVLEPGLAVRLELAGATALAPDEELQLRLRLRSGGGIGAVLVELGPEERSALVRLSAPGEYELRWQGWDGGELGTSPSIHVAETELEQVFEVGPDHAALEDARRAALQDG